MIYRQLGTTGIEVSALGFGAMRLPMVTIGEQQYVDIDLAVVYPPLMPVSFWRYLRDRGLRLVEVAEEEFPTMGTNVLAVSPGKCIMLQGNPQTRERLEAAGCEVWTYVGREISLKAEGGPTCLTRPLLREYG